jgi:uncharacterized protein (UPF0332 family)
VKEQTGAYLDKSRELLDDAEAMLRIDRHEAAGGTAYLGRTYNLKAIADYLTGPGSHVSAEDARSAVETAKRFIDCIVSLLA